MMALEHYISEHGYEETVNLLNDRVLKESNANLKMFFANCITRLPSYMDHLNRTSSNTLL